MEKVLTGAGTQAGGCGTLAQKLKMMKVVLRIFVQMFGNTLLKHVIEFDH